jgi:flagellar assembly protein FliH
MSISYKSLFPSAAAPAPIEPFRYPETPHGLATGSDSEFEGDPSNDEITELLLKAHAEGVKEGEEKERARGIERLVEEQNKISVTVEQFQSQVAAYYSRTESEVVQLSLAIASKILHRETQADPTLVAKLAKGVLDKLHQNTKVRVRVHPPDVENWRQYFSRNNDSQIPIEVIGDESVGPENCLLEADLGATQIGIDAQLKEVEAGLLDLLAESQR